MNKLKEVKPTVFLTCFLLGIATLSIYSFASGFIVVGNNSSDKIASEPRAAVMEEERRLFMEEKYTLYTSSRGGTNRTAEDSQAGQAEIPHAAAAAKPAEPAAAKQTAPAPIKPAAKSAPAPKAEASAESGYAYELDLLARLITAEAQSEPYEAKVAVGAVVINRVQSGQWADTIKAVIYQKFDGYYQFTPVQNGWINKPAEPESVKAAETALSGADPTNGAQFYYDDKTTNAWILAKPVSVQIGHMIFAF